MTVTGDDLFQSLGPWADHDDTGDLRDLVESVVAPLDEIESLSRDSDDGPGWSAVLDVDRAPNVWLDWLAQFPGVRIPDDLTEAERRQTVRDTAGFRRGSLRAIRAAAAVHLTGTQYVRINERTTSAYAFEVITYSAETPDPVTVEASLRAAKPGGLVMVYTVLNGVQINDLVGTVDAQTGTVDEYESVVP